MARVERVSVRAAADMRTKKNEPDVSALDVIVSPAPARARGVLENLFQLYTHDFTEFWRGEGRGELDPNGLYAPYPELELYWSERDHTPLFIHVGEHLAGFALINPVGHSRLPCDYNMAEFFIVRKHRRAGIGLTAATSIIAERPGRWEIAVIDANKPALAFWPRVVAALPNTRDIDLLKGESFRWPGDIIRFALS